MNLTEAFTQLIAETQLYLFQEYSPKDWLLSDGKTYQFFKAHFLENRTQESKPLLVATQPALVPLVQKPLKAEEAPSKVPAPPPKKAAAESTPTQIESKEQKSPAVRPFFSLEPLAKPKELNLSDMRAAISTHCPQIELKEIPHSPQVKKLRKVAIALLTRGETGEELLFIHNVTSAIDRLLQPAEIAVLPEPFTVEEWQTLLKRHDLKWLIVFGDIAQFPGLEKVNDSLYKIGAISILLQPAVATLLRNQQQKTDLWKVLKQLFQIRPDR